MIRWTIRRKLTTVFLLLAVTPIVLIGLQAYAVSRRTLEKRIGQGLQRQSVRVIEQIDQTLFEQYQNVRSWSADPVMADVLTQDADGRISALLTTLKQQYGLYAELICADQTGKIVSSSHPRLLGRSIAHTPWFQEALSAEAVKVQDLAISELVGGYGLVFAAPIRPAVLSSAEPPKTIGALGAFLNWSEILNLVNTIPILEEQEHSQAAYAILIDQKGLALTQPYFDERDLILQENLIQAGLQTARQATEGTSGYLVERGLYGSQDLIGFAPSKGYRDFQGLGWSVLVFQRTREAFQPVRALQLQIFLISVLVAAFVIFVSAVLTRRMTTPILQIARIARRVAQGDFEGRVEYTSGDEIGSLTETLNQMIQDLKKQRAQLVEKAYVENIIRSMINTLIVIDPSGTIKTVNRAACELLGYKEEELLGKPLAQIFAEDPPLPASGLDGSMEQAFVSQVESAYLAKDGRKIPVLFSSAVLQGDRGKIEGIVCVAQDITDLKQAEQALKQRAEELARSNKELEQFAYVASHDLQQPLRMITSFTQLLARRYKDKLDSEADEFIRYAVEGGSRMQLLINDLLAYSRVGSRGKPFAPTDCTKLAAEAVANLKLAIEESHAAVTSDGLPTVMADGSQLRQVFQNLLDNAVKFRQKDVPLQVHIFVKRQDSEWVFAIRDNGIGIDPKHFNRLFVIFQRLHTEAEYPGTGIGLAICKKTIERHGGRIWVESQPGQGSTFYFAIPVAQPEGTTA
jgi:PAS domain S-box-containing protein